MRNPRPIIQLLVFALVLAGVFLVGGHAEGWCPFGGVEGLYTYVREGALPCSLSVSNFYVLGGLLLATLLLRRAFCGYLCPLGAIGEAGHALGRRLGLRALTPGARLDRGLRWIKYPLLIVLLVLTYRAGELIFRGFDPCYALISRHGEDITVWAYVSLGALAVGSLWVRVPFCRWLCPLAAVINAFSRFGATRIWRDRATCIDCGRCARACPTGIPVDRRDQVYDADCYGCFDCVRACPVAGPAALGWSPVGTRRRWPQAILVGLLVLLIGSAVGAIYLAPQPSFVALHGELPSDPATLELTVGDLTCRGRANLLVYFLERDDLYALAGPWRLEAWPAPESGRIRLAYDAARATPDELRHAITEPYFDPIDGFWRHSPFYLAD